MNSEIFELNSLPAYLLQNDARSLDLEPISRLSQERVFAYVILNYFGTTSIYLKEHNEGELGSSHEGIYEELINDFERHHRSIYDPKTHLLKNTFDAAFIRIDNDIQEVFIEGKCVQIMPYICIRFDGDLTRLKELDVYRENLAKSLRTMFPQCKINAGSLSVDYQFGIQSLVMIGYNLPRKIADAKAAMERNGEIRVGD